MVNETISIDNRNTQLLMFIVLLVVEIASIFCTLFILTFFFVNWHVLMCKALHNHAIFLLMIVSFLYITLDLPVTINYYRLGYESPRTHWFCLWWYWIDYTLVVISLFLTATASVQRHILVFHTHWLHTFRTRWLLHFLPLIFCFVYPSMFYSIFLLIYPCKNLIDANHLKCPYPCYANHFVLFFIDSIINTIVPVMIIVIANMTLINRVIYSLERFRRCRTRTWKRRRRLTLQLFAFSSLYVFGWMPSTVMSIVRTFVVPNLYIDTPNLYHVNTSSYFVCPLQPFICFFALPKLTKLIKIRMRRQRTISAISAFFFHETRF
jgi:hypothetical protein